jgi:transcriptional regulator with XRE-family HTH domain
MTGGDDTADDSATIVDTIISRALGYELRLVREAKGWGRGQTVQRLPSGIGARTLLSYEHGTRRITVLRFVQLCRVLDVSASVVLATALQRARLFFDVLHLRVDLRMVLRDETPEFRVLHRWAYTKLHRSGTPIADLAPESVADLADFIQRDPYDLAVHLSRFVPEGYPSAETLPDDAGALITAHIVRVAGVAS